MLKRRTLDLKISHRFDEFYERFRLITERGINAGLKIVSKDLREAMITATANLSSYMKSAHLTEELHAIGGPDRVPHEIDDHIIKVLNDLDDQMTLELSALV